MNAAYITKGYVKNTCKQQITANGCDCLRSSQNYFQICAIFSTAFVATFVPNYGAFLAICGCFMGGATLFVIPCLCYIVVYRKERETNIHMNQYVFLNRTAYHLIVVLLIVSVIAGLVALYAAVYTEFY